MWLVAHDNPLSWLMVFHRRVVASTVIVMIRAIKKRAAHSETFLGGLVCTGNLAFRLDDCFNLNDSENCIIRKTWLHCI